MLGSRFLPFMRPSLVGRLLCCPRMALGDVMTAAPVYTAMTSATHHGDK